MRPRFPLAALPTPLVRARRLEARLGSPPIYLKRDDLSGFAVAGHKARQLEYLLGEALATDREVIVTGGGPSSNWAAATAVAAQVAGRRCELVSYGERPDRLPAQLAIALAAGAHVHYTGTPDRDHQDVAIEELAATLPRSFPIPRGGANPTGAHGMAVAAAELAAQLAAEAVAPEAVVVAAGSGGGYAGLLNGAAPHLRVVGASVSRPLDQAVAAVTKLTRHRPELVDMVGPGFGVPSEEGEAAARLAFETEGLLLDPTYTAKAFALMLRLAAVARRPLVFWHTGGILTAADHLVRSQDIRV